MKMDNKIRYGLSLKADRDMRIGNKDNDKNRKKYLAKNKLEIKNTIAAGLVHGNNVMIVAKNSPVSILPHTDALITDIPGIILTVTVADCLPIYIWDKNRSVAGLIHAGWRGLATGVVRKTINKIVRRYKTDPCDLIVNIGPHIKKCHFEVGPDVFKKFAKYPGAIMHYDKKLYIDLAKITREQLIAAGVNIKNIKVSRDCTYCQKKYFSFRRDKPDIVKGALAWVTIRES